MRPPIPDLLGRRFGQLVVIARAATAGHWHARWSVVCDCGSVTDVRGSDLVRGMTTSCQQHQPRGPDGRFRSDAHHPLPRAAEQRDAQPTVQPTKE